MASTVIRGAQIKDSTVQRHDLDTSTVGQAVVTKLVQGSGVTLSSTGADSGTGDVTVSTSAIPLASSSTSGLMNQTSGNTTDFIDGTNASQPLQPVIWSVRLRSFNAIGNPNFEVAQRNCRSAIVNPGAGVMLEDRWQFGTNLSATGQGFLTSLSAGQGIPVQGTSFIITTASLRVTVGTQKTSLAATDVVYLQQIIEGSGFRELMSDVHSSQVLARSSVANLKFGVYLKDPTGTRSLTKLCTLGAANTITLIQLPNLPVFPSAGTFTAAIGSAGYAWGIGLAAGSSLTSPANDTWQNGNFSTALGQDNFMANVAGSTFEAFFVQHQPGALCETLIDKPFTQNLFECQRYFAKSYSYGTKPATVTNASQRTARIHPSFTSNTYDSVPFPVTMAKAPTVTIYSPDGTVNVAQVAGGSNVTVSSVTYIGDSAFSGFSLGTAQTANNTMFFHYTADTGW